MVAMLMWTGISWETMCLLICLWSSLFLILRLFLVEPPKFLLSKGKTELAAESLKYIARFNGHPLPETFVLLHNSSEDNTEVAQDNTAMESLSNRTLITPIIMSMIIYFTCGYIYYGISMNIQNYKGNIYENAALNGLVEVISIFFSGIAMSAWGIRIPFFISFAVSGLSTLGMRLSTQNPDITSLFMAFTKFGISSCFNFSYVTVGEIFPSNIKSTVLGFCLIADRAGSILGPILGLYPKLFQVISLLLCGFCVPIVIKFPFKSKSKNNVNKRNIKETNQDIETMSDTKFT